MKNIALTKIELVESPYEKINLILNDDNMPFFLKYSFDSNFTRHISSVGNGYLFVGAALDLAVKCRTEIIW